MLSRQAQALTTLVVARHILLAQAVEANAAYDYLVALHQPPFDRIRPTTDSEDEIHRKFSEVMAELRIMPALLDQLEQRIARAWQRLETAGSR